MTPFAQILASLRTVRNNYVQINNVSLQKYGISFVQVFAHLLNVWSQFAGLGRVLPMDQFSRLDLPHQEKWTQVKILTSNDYYGEIDRMTTSFSYRWISCSNGNWDSGGARLVFGSAGNDSNSPIGFGHGFQQGKAPFFFHPTYSTVIGPFIKTLSSA